MTHIVCLLKTDCSAVISGGINFKCILEKEGVKKCPSKRETDTKTHSAARDATAVKRVAVSHYNNTLPPPSPARRGASRENSNQLSRLDCD